MRQRKPGLVVTFYTTADAMALEQQCREAGIPGKLFSAPRALSSDCGIAWQSPIDQKSIITNVIIQSGIEIHGLHEMMV